MADYYPPELQKLVSLLARLPGVGRRSADKAALELVAHPERLEEISHALAAVNERVSLCPTCRGLSSAGEMCSICCDARREERLVCVVEGISDLTAMERSGFYRGRYFVLHRLLSPLKGIGPDDLGLELLEARCSSGQVQELVLATPMTADGETTATYLRRTLSPYPIRITRLATGVPVGGTLEYLDGVTLSRALADRKEFEPV